MGILMVGLSFKTSPLEVREALHLRPEEEGEVGRHLDGTHEGLVVLSTCHRTEMYLECPDRRRSLERCWDLLAHRACLSAEDLRRYAYDATDFQAARHLLRVASGLDSMVVGERQVLRQVGQAHERAVQRRESAPTLSFLFRHALVVGRRVHAETGIGAKPVSIGTAALALAREIIGPPANASTLLIGSGEMGTEVGKELAALDPGRLLLANRTYERARKLASMLGGIPADYHRVGQLLEECDMVVSATNAPHYVISAEAARRAADRRRKPLLLLDLGMPRNIDPRVAQIPGMVLHNIDDLQEVLDQDRLQRAGDIERADGIIEEGLRHFKEWLRLRPVDGALGTLGKELEAIRQGELARALPKLSRLSSDEMAVIDSMTKAMVKKFLFRPAETLRERIPPEDAPVLRRAIEDLFLRGRPEYPNGHYVHGWEGDRHVLEAPIEAEAT
jgi:glutamyl-tRNA reductase